MSEIISVAVFQIQSPLEVPFRALKSWRSARQTQKALSALSEIELADIGIERGDIDRIARRTK